MSVTPPASDYVTSGEFGRYVTEEIAYRGRVAEQLKGQYVHIVGELSEIKGLVRSTNGRVGKAESAIAVIERELSAIKSEDLSIEGMVEDIKAHGCAQLETHREVLTTLGWSPQRKAAVAGGLLGAGALMWPAIQKVAEAVLAVLEHTP